MNKQDTKPAWLKIRPAYNTDFSKIKQALRKRKLTTVCEEANCPNMAECWHDESTATFMIMGDTCTRACKFCAVKTAFPARPLDHDEPRKIAEAIKEIKLDYAVITSVDRDDLEDGGASHFAECIRQIRKEIPSTHIEVLIPDFGGSVDALKKIIEARPDVIGHNIEVVKELQKKVRDQRANYEQSLDVLKNVKELSPDTYTKSSIMLGLGETKEQVINAMKDLRSVQCNILTIGQYLKPKNKMLEVEEYIKPEVFEDYKKLGEELGFLYVASGPFVRSSYRAGELFIKNVLVKKRWDDAAKGNTALRSGIPSNP